MIEFTVARGEVIKEADAWDPCKGETYPVLVNPQDVTYVSGRSMLSNYKVQPPWTMIVVKGVGELFVQGNYDEVVEKLRKAGCFT